LFGQGFLQKLQCYRTSHSLLSPESSDKSRV
jgi:hypothetical protein